MDYLINDEVEKIIDNKKDKLINLWYNLEKDEDFDYVVDWFIDIANSMLSNDTDKKPNITIGNIMRTYMEFEYRFSSHFWEENEKNTMAKLYWRDYKSEIWYEFRDTEDDFETRHIKMINNKYRFFLYLAKKETLRNFWEYDYIKEKLINDNNLIEKFNKWELTKLEEEIFQFIKKDNKKKKSTIISLSYKNNERYKELVERNKWKPYIIEAYVFNDDDYKEMIKIYYKIKNEFNIYLDTIKISDFLKNELLKRIELLIFESIEHIRNDYLKNREDILEKIDYLRDKFKEEIQIFNEIKKKSIKKVNKLYEWENIDLIKLENKNKDYIEISNIPLSELNNKEKQKYNVKYNENILF